MCTIMTVSSSYFSTNADAVIERIRVDARGNGDGWSLIAYRYGDASSTSIRATDLGTVLAMVPWLLTDNYDRIWLHARYSTGSYIGLNYTHGFTAGHHSVMHNGILRADAAARYEVDSQLIPDLITTLGILPAARHLVATEHYANCLIVDTSDGSYVVTRTATGSLHTDGEGNYSSGQMPGIDKVVPVGIITHEAPLVPLKVPENYEEFLEWIYDHNYDEFMPDDVKEQLTWEQASWLRGVQGYLGDDITHYGKVGGRW